MANNEVCVEVVTDKIYFIEDNIHISFKFNKKVRIVLLYYEFIKAIDRSMRFPKYIIIIKL